MVAATSQVGPAELYPIHGKVFQQISKNESMMGPEFRHKRLFGWGWKIKAPTAIGKATRCWGTQVVWATTNAGVVVFSISLETSVFSSWFDKNLDPTHYSIFLSRVRGFVNWEKESKKRYPLESPQRPMSSCAEILRAWTCRRSVVASYGAMLLREFIGVYASVCLSCVDALDV